MIGDPEGLGPSEEDLSSGLSEPEDKSPDQKPEVPDTNGKTPRESYLDLSKPKDDVDKRDEVPDLKLLEGERVINVEHPESPEPIKYPSSLKAVLKIVGDVDHTSEIGEKGPAVAASTREDFEGAVVKYGVYYGRDSLHIAQFLNKRYKELLPATVVKLAELQGVKTDPYSKEEPGRIVHDSRSPDDPIARNFDERGWGWPHYGQVDANPLFLTGVRQVVQDKGLEFLNKTYEGRDGKEHTMRYAFKNALKWTEDRLDSNKEGLLEFTRSPVIDDDPEAWKDSSDSYFHADGSIANRENGIAVVEVQAYAYDALMDSVSLYRQLATEGGENQTNYENKAQELSQRAEKLKATFMNNFWIEDERGGYFALGTDRDENGNLRPMKVRTSNMGRVLNSKLLYGDDNQTKERAEATVKTLMSPEMLNVSGIRTVSNREIRFRPGAFHDGSVWMWDTFYVAQGLEYQGYYGLANDLKNRILNVIAKTKRFPETVRGDDNPEPTLNNRVIDLWDEENQFRNRIEQPAEEVQAWTVAAVHEIKHQRDPLHPEKRLPTQAIEPDKRAFEEKILSGLK